MPFHHKRTGPVQWIRTTTTTGLNRLPLPLGYYRRRDYIDVSGTGLWLGLGVGVSVGVSFGTGVSTGVSTGEGDSIGVSVGLGDGAQALTTMKNRIAATVDETRFTVTPK